MNQSSTQFRAGVPVLPSPDVNQAVEFYRDTLGFEIAFLSEEPYAIVTRDDVCIHLWQCSDPELPTHCGCRIVVKGIDELYQEYEPLGVVHPNAPLEETSWGTKEFAIGDGDKNLITFEENVSKEN